MEKQDLENVCRLDSNLKFMWENEKDDPYPELFFYQFHDYIRAYFFINSAIKIDLEVLVDELDQEPPYKVILCLVCYLEGCKHKGKA